jgi:hypothetical protein
MRSIETITAEISSVKTQLKLVDSGLSRLPRVVVASRVGGGYEVDRAEFVPKLEALKAELLPVAKSGVKA